LTGGDADGRRAAQARLDNLRAAEDAQSEANANVASIKRQVIRLRQQLQAAQADLNLANIRASQAARKDTELSRKPEKDLRPGEKDDSAAEKTRTEDERKAAQRRVDTLNDAQTGLAAQLRNAEEQLEIAQAAFEQASNKTIRAAQAESAAFANARDNAPFWFAPGVATSTDPAKRVEITSSTGGENAIFIRGAKDDIAKVQDIIAKLDEPAPQARMTLWKIELNSDATQKGAEKFNESLRIVEQELADTRKNSRHIIVASRRC
jgi:type II secretory pathway component GspD/PulD (secretin)